MYDAFWINTPLRSPFWDIFRIKLWWYCTATTKQTRTTENNSTYRLSVPRREESCSHGCAVCSVLSATHLNTLGAAGPCATLRATPSAVNSPTSPPAFIYRENIYKTSVSSPQPWLFKTITYRIHLSIGARASWAGNVICLRFLWAQSQRGKGASNYTHGRCDTFPYFV